MIGNIKELEKAIATCLEYIRVPVGIGIKDGDSVTISGLSIENGKVNWDCKPGDEHKFVAKVG